MTRTIAWLAAVLMTIVAGGAWAQVNMVNNGSFDAGNAGWSYGSNTYFYTAGPDTICSMGWWNDVAIWQNTGYEMLADTPYTLTVRAASGDGQIEGLALVLSDVDDAWTDVLLEEFWFPAEDQGQEPGPWREFSVTLDTADYPAIVGHRVAVGIRLRDTEAWGQYGWLWVDEVVLSRPVATDPSPADGATGVPTDAVLSWAPAVGQVAEHRIYMSNGAATDPNIPETPVAVVPGGTNSWDPSGAYELELDGYYWWRVDEAMADDATDPNYFGGYVWSFETTKSAPVIEIQPADAGAFPVGTVEFTVAATSVTPESYEWFRYVADGEDVSMGTGATLTLTGVGLDDEGLYYAVVSNAGGATGSEMAYLTVNRAVAHWTMDGALFDTAGDPLHQWDGTYVDPNEVNPDPVAQYVGGITGSALELGENPLHVQIDGSEEYFNLYVRGMTVSAWVNTTSQSWNSFVAKENRSVEPWTGFVLGTDWQGQPVLSLRGAGSMTADVAVNDGQWHLVTAVYDASAGTARLYVDGLLNQSAEEIPALAPTDAPLTLGAETLDGTVAPLDGLLDDVRIYNYAMDSLSVAGIWFEMLPGAEAICLDGVTPATDLNGDCTVDLDDLAQFASGWLESNLVTSEMFE